jgi:hypothetical protein
MGEPIIDSQSLASQEACPVQHGELVLGHAREIEDEGVFCVSSRIL